MIADIHYKFKSSQAPKAKLQSSRHTGKKAEFNGRWSFKVMCFRFSGKSQLTSKYNAV